MLNKPGRRGPTCCDSFARSCPSDMATLVQQCLRRHSSSSSKKKNMHWKNRYKPVPVLTCINHVDAVSTVVTHTVADTCPRPCGSLLPPASRGPGLSWGFRRAMHESPTHELDGHDSNLVLGSSHACITIKSALACPRCDASLSRGCSSACGCSMPLLRCTQRHLEFRSPRSPRFPDRIWTGEWFPPFQRPMYHSVECQEV